MEEAVAHWNQVGTPLLTLRSPELIARFFDGLDLLEPSGTFLQKRLVNFCTKGLPRLRRVRSYRRHKDPGRRPVVA